MKKTIFFQNLILVLTLIIAVPKFLGEDINKEEVVPKEEINTSEVENLNTNDNSGTYGTFLLPSKSIEYPIYKGSELLDEVDMIMDTDYGIPGNEKDDVILAGHNAYIGKDLEKMERDDIITLENAGGEKYYYQVRNTEIVEEENTEILTNTNNTEDLIIYTCYPFNSANTSKRYIVEASPIEVGHEEYQTTSVKK